MTGEQYFLGFYFLVGVVNNNLRQNSCCAPHFVGCVTPNNISLIEIFAVSHVQNRTAPIPYCLYFLCFQ